MKEQIIGPVPSVTRGNTNKVPVHRKRKTKQQSTSAACKSGAREKQ